MEVGPRQQSEFNDAVGYLGRLNSLFYLADEASIQMDAHRWFTSLMALFRELSTEMGDKEIEHGTDTINDINPKVAAVNKEYRRTGTVIIDNVLYMKLNDFEIWLRKIMKSAGLQLRMFEDAGKALK